MSGYKVLLQKQFSLQVKALRHKRNLTQEEMSERLHITSRAYSDLERGCSCCSALALLFFLPPDGSMGNMIVALASGIVAVVVAFIACTVILKKAYKEDV